MPVSTLVLLGANACVRGVWLDHAWHCLPLLVTDTLPR
jgi:hypothetical protein